MMLQPTSFSLGPWIGRRSASDCWRPPLRRLVTTIWRPGTMVRRRNRSSTSSKDHDRQGAARTTCRPAERIATFDNDGTLWSEQPMYVQGLFALDRVKALAPQHPEWQTQEPFASILKGDLKAALAGGDKALLEIVMATHAGMTTEEFQAIVKDWIATAKNPVTKRPGARDGLPADGRAARVPAGARLQDVHRLGRRHRVHAPVDREGLWRSARAGGWLAASRRSTRSGTARPYLSACRSSTSSTTRTASRSASTSTSAAGRSRPSATRMATGRCWSTRRLALAARGSAMLVLHDDKAREFAYGPATGLPDSHVGTFTQALYDEAKQRGWIVISMKDDWKQRVPTGSRLHR